MVSKGMEIYIKDTYNGHIHKLGSNCHDSLYVNDEGHIDYLNLQCCEGTRFGGYIFCDRNGNDLRDWVEDYNYLGIGKSIGYSQESYEKALEDITKLVNENKLFYKNEDVSSLVKDYITSLIRKLKDGEEDGNTPN